MGGHDYCLLREATSDDREAADLAYHQLRVDLAQERRAEAAPQVLTLGLAAVRFLRHLDARVEGGEVTRRYYRTTVHQISRFLEAFGDRDIASITGDEITDWLYSQPWKQGMRSDTLNRIKRIWQACKVPFPEIAAIPQGRREAIPTPEEFAELLTAIASVECREVLSFIASIGCRPNEAYSLTASMLDLGRGVAIRQGKTTKKTGHKRVLYLPLAWIPRLKELAEKYPEGPLLRTHRGLVWIEQNMYGHIRRAKAGRDWPWATPYALRHLFITQALRAHLPIAHVAALVGHADTSMISRVYSHLTRHDEDLHAALEQVNKPKRKKR